MRKLILIVSLGLFFSCGESTDSTSPNSANILENLTYSVDTVIVDPGEELINLSMGLYFSDVSKDNKWLYHFDLDNSLINAIDLEKFVLDHKIEFEKEGPDGVGSYISSIQALANENFLITTFQSSGIFNSEGKKIEDATIEPTEITGIDEEDEVELAFQLTSSDDRKYLFSLPGDYMASGRDLVVLDKAKKTGKSFDIPKLDLTGDFSIIQNSGEMAEIYMEEYFLEEFENEVYIASSVTSDIYSYELTTDSLSFYSFPLQVAPKAKTELPKREVSSREEYKEQRDLVQSQISYSSLLWDKSREMFFRIGSTVKAIDTSEGKHTVGVYLIAFDQSMNLLGETKIDDLTSVPSYPFFKDGKLYSYVNVEDELGFAVFTFDF